MRPDITPIRELVWAFRSGMYRQVRGQQQDDSGRCCAFYIAYQLGLHHHLSLDQVDQLIEWNDETGLTFEEMADEIERAGWTHEAL